MASKRQKTAKKGAKPSGGRDPRAAVIDGALAQASRREWVNVTLADIADEASVSLADMALMFDGREDILCAYARRVDADVLKDFEPSGNERDRIFDVLMERFERLNRDREAVLSFTDSCKSDPKQLVIACPDVARSMSWMLEACGLETQGWKGAARVAGLTLIYIWVLRTWRDDASPDLGKTMAALDKALGRMENVATRIGL